VTPKPAKLQKKKPHPEENGAAGATPAPKHKGKKAATPADEADKPKHSNLEPFNKEDQTEAEPKPKPHPELENPEVKPKPKLVAPGNGEEPVKKKKAEDGAVPPQ
jgi:hypothetical protein